jgi:hypothetical protein
VRYRSNGRGENIDFRSARFWVGDMATATTPTTTTTTDAARNPVDRELKTPRVARHTPMGGAFGVPLNYGFVVI